MLSTQGPSDATSTVRIKSLHELPSRTEQKDLEIEDEEPANNEISVDQVEISVSQEMPAEHEIQSGLSTRASAIKHYLQDKSEVKAIVLKSDGTSESISYDASSLVTRSLLSGRPSIVGEIEDLQLVVVKAMDSSSSSGSNNKHTLPAPLCHAQSRGDYVLFRVDASGKVADVTLEEYQKYVDDHKTLTETSSKHHSADSQQIKSNSPFGSKNAMEQLRGALETHFYDQLSSAVDAEPERTDADIEDAVKQHLQQIVDDAVSAFGASPMEDADYDPVEDVESQQGQESAVEEDSEVEELDERPWREQLKDALEHVERVGRVDKEAFADMICDTFHEVNGTDPTLEQLTSLYSRIRTDFANEAEEELDDESSAAESETEDDSESVYGDHAGGHQWGAALDHIRDIARLDGRALAERVFDALCEETGDVPSLDELSSVWQNIQSEFEAEAQEDIDGDTEEDSEEDIAEEDEYSTADRSVQTGDALEFAVDTVGADWVSRAQSLFMDEEGREPTESELEDTVMAFASEMAGNVLARHFGEVDSEMDIEMEYGVESEEREQEDVDSEYNPSNSVDQGLARRDVIEDVKHEQAHFDVVMLNTPMVTSRRGGGVCWEVFFEEGDLNEEAEQSNLGRSIDGFKMMNKREPTPSEVSKIRQFLAVPVELCDENDLLVDSHSALIQTPIRTSDLGHSAAWTVFLGKSQGSLEGAKRAFQHHRELSTVEEQSIQSFLAGKAVSNEESDSEQEDDLEVESQAQSSKVLVSPVSEKKTAKRYNVYLEDSKYSQEATEKMAIKFFNRFNKRDANQEDVAKIKAFIQKEADLEEQQFLVSVKLDLDDGDDDEKDMDLPSRSTAGGSLSKSATKGFAVEFDDDEKRGDEDEEEAIQWFKRFNNRGPSKVDTHQSTKVEEDEMIDIE